MNIGFCIIPFKNFYLLVWSLLLFSLHGNAQKINGMSLAGPQHPSLTKGIFEEMQGVNINWVALIPEATLDRSTLRLLPDNQNHWWGHTMEANIQAIQLAKLAGLKVFLKPHIVLGELPSEEQPLAMYTTKMVTKKPPPKDKTRGAEWRGSLKLKSERDWKILEASYETYILKLAAIAEAFDVELFAVGTELGNFTGKRPAYWRQLIHKVRQVYNGKLIYCANWDEYDKIGFWNDLDYIGVDSYFPISRMETPDIKRTKRNWRPVQKKLKRLSKHTNRQILLTEFGYRNVPFAGKKPWTHDKGPATINNDAQERLYSAFFQTFWDKSWVAGGFAWQWFPSPNKQRATSFSIQNKPALEILKNWYGREG